MLKAYKYRMYPNQQQIELLDKHFGCVRFVYNWGLEQKIKAYQAEKKTLSCFDLTKQLAVSLKIIYPWLAEVNAQSLQMSLRNLDNAFTKFFKKQNRFPKFKSKRTKQSFQCPQRCSFDFTDNKLSIPKLKGIKIKFDRQFEGKIKTVTISKTCTDKYFASILVDDGKELPIPIIPEKAKSIGIDLGIKHFAVFSNGKKIENSRFLILSEKKLVRVQRFLSRKQKGSANRSKARRIVARVHEQVFNQRRDFLHKLSKRLIDENQAICLEDLDVTEMLKNNRFAKYISDVGWKTFRSFCEYKAKWYGKSVRVIGRFEPSSKMCDHCGEINISLTLADRVWTCNCGTVHDRDILAARNILNFAFINTVGTTEI